jgi:hypothetical protein
MKITKYIILVHLVGWSLLIDNARYKNQNCVGCNCVLVMQLIFSFPVSLQILNFSVVSMCSPFSLNYKMSMTSLAFPYG